MPSVLSWPTFWLTSATNWMRPVPPGCRTSGGGDECVAGGCRAGPSRGGVGGRKGGRGAEGADRFGDPSVEIDKGKGEFPPHCRLEHRARREDPRRLCFQAAVAAH